MILKESNRYICGGGTNGKVMLFDPNQMRAPVSEFQAHTGQLSDMTVQENLLVTCGWSLRQNGSMVPDRILKVRQESFYVFVRPSYVFTNNFNHVERVNISEQQFESDLGSNRFLLLL